MESFSDIAVLLGNDCEQQVVEERVEHILRQLSENNQVIYGCLTQKQFLQNTLRANPFYSKYVLCKDLRKQRVLEVGCCLGTDTRRLIYDGFNVSSIVAIDVNFHFIELGFHLFQDRESPVASCFVEKNVAADDLVEFLQEKTSLPPFTMVLANAVFHALSLQEFEKALKNITRLLEMDGILIGYLPTLKSEDRNEPFRSMEAYQNPRIIHSTNHLRQMLEKNGFQHIETYSRCITQVFPSQQETPREWQEVDITFFVATKSDQVQ